MRLQDLRLQSKAQPLPTLRAAPALCRGLLWSSTLSMRHPGPRAGTGEPGCGWRVTGSPGSPVPDLRYASSGMMVEGRGLTALCLCAPNRSRHGGREGAECGAISSLLTCLR